MPVGQIDIPDGYFYTPVARFSHFVSCWQNVAPVAQFRFPVGKKTFLLQNGSTVIGRTACLSLVHK